MPQTLVDDEGNPIQKYSVVDDEGNPIEIPSPPPLTEERERKTGAEDPRIREELKRIDPGAIPPEPGQFRFRGETFFDPNADWWDKIKDAAGILDASQDVSRQTSGAAEFERRISESIPRLFGPRGGEKNVPFKEGTRPTSTDPSLLYPGPTLTTGQRAYNEIVQGVGQSLESMISDPRTYLSPFLFRAVPPKGMRSPTRTRAGQEIWDENLPWDPNVRNVTPKPRQGQIEGRIDYGGEGGLASVTPKVPPPTGMSPRRFLGSPSGAIQVANTLGQPISLEQETPWPVGANEGMPRDLVGPIGANIPEPSDIPSVFGPRTGTAFSSEGIIPGSRFEHQTSAEVPDVTPPAPPEATAPSPVFPRFKNVQKPTRFKEPTSTAEKLRLTRTANGEIVDSKTGEVVSKGTETPQFMRAKKNPNNIAVGGAEPRVLDILGTTLYSKNIERVVSKELLQNAVDEMRLSGNTGPIKVLMSLDTPIPGTSEMGTSFTIRDFGRGMKPQQLYTVFTNVGESGKASEASASGGFGFAKAAPLLGGQYAKVVSVVDDKGKRMRYTFEGSPAQLKNQDLGVPLKMEEVDKTVPTGLKVTTYFPKGNNFYDTRDHLESVGNFSTNIPVNIQSKMGYDFRKVDDEKWVESPDPANSSLLKDYAPKNLPTPNFTVNLPTATVGVYIDNTKLTNTSRYTLNVLNNGLYDSSYPWQGYGADLENVPGNITVNIKSKVEEGAPGYPFTVNREQLDEKVSAAIKALIKREVGDKARKATLDQVQKLYDSIIPMNEGMNYKWGIVDPEGKYHPKELAALGTDAVVQALMAVVDRHIKRGIDLVGEQSWERLEGVGLLFEDEIWGVHIPNNTTNKSSIFINPFYHPPNTIEVATPRSHAANIAHTVLHEMAHIEPKGFGEDAHGKGFAGRLGKIYAAMGVETNAEDELAREILAIIAPGNGDKYSPEFQELLQQYLDTRGRAATKKSAFSGSSEVSYSRARRQGGDGSNTEPNGGRIPPRSIWDETGAVNIGGKGYDPNKFDRVGKPPTPTQPFDTMIKEKAIEEGVVLRALGLTKGLRATGDMAPLLRQGYAYAGREFWRKAATQQFRIYASEEGYQSFLRKQSTDSFLQPEGPRGETIAQQMGLKLNLGRKGWDFQEERVMGIEDAEKLVGALTRGIINPAAASNRVYHATVDTFRLGAAHELYDAYNRYYLSAMKTAKNETELREAMAMNPKNPLIRKRIGEEVNQTSGASSLNFKERSLPESRFLGPLSGKTLIGKDEWNFEPGAKWLNALLFSPRLAKSKIEQYQKLLNPFSWKRADPVMRREYLKQILSMGMARAVLTGLGALMGGTVYHKATQSDWGKSAFGRKKRTVLDTTGGGGKLEVLASRFAQRTYTTAKGKSSPLGQGPFIPSGGDLVRQYGEGLSAPAFGLFWDIADRSEMFGGPQPKGMGFNPATDIPKQLLLPMLAEDVYEILNEDPSLFPILFPLDAIGAGVDVYPYR